MNDIIVTTPKSAMATAAAEAANCRAIIEAGGEAWYLRKVGRIYVYEGSRVYYVEDGYIRGFAVVFQVAECHGETCATTGKRFSAGRYARMLAESWRWIDPIPMKGFQGARYARFMRSEVDIVGNWKDPKPEIT